MSNNNFELKNPDKETKINWFIEQYTKLNKYNKINNKQKENANKLAEMWVNMLYYQCRYSPAIEDEIKDVIKNNISANINNNHKV